MIFSTIGAVVAYFRQHFTSGTTLESDVLGGDAWGDYAARLSRHEVYWAHYENTAYDRVHAWADSYLVNRGLYRYTRGVYNPTKRLVDFHTTHLMGGTIDPEAGDGRETPSCLPVLTTNEPLRQAIAILWRDSKWQVNKELFCRLGTALGEAPLRIVDDPDEGRVAMEVVHPSTIRWAKFDCWGRVQAYLIHDRKPHPKAEDRRIADPLNDPSYARTFVDYDELCHLDEATGVVHYRTYLNGKPYAWNGTKAEWTEPYGFVPLVIHPHQRMTTRSFWGWPEIHPAHAKVTNLDDLASLLHDQIRKAVRPKWFFTNTQDPARSGRNLRFNHSAPTNTDPQPERQELDALYGGSGATVNAMVFPLDIQFTSMEIQNAQADLERDFPELRFDRLRATGDASAKALREARKPAEAKVHAVRAGYDGALVLADKMAVVIGGMRDYPGYEPFGLLALNDPLLDHRIGPRSVFNQDPLDIIEEEQAMLTAVQTGASATSRIPAEITLERCGWDKVQIDALFAARLREQDELLDFQRRQLELARQFEPPPPARTGA